MGSPIIIDDGGSLRLKLINSGVGDMDNLRDVKPGVPEAGRKGSQHNEKVTNSGDNYGRVVITYIDSKGNPTRITDKPFTSRVVVTSENHEVLAAIEQASGLKHLKLIVHGPDHNRPEVDSKQHPGQRRYIVSNASPIMTVFVDGGLELDVAKGSPTGDKIIYTSVFVT
jgi:hypothetical protein